MRRVAHILFYFVVVLLGLIFTLLNQNAVTLNYHIGQLELPLAALVILAILLGSILGVILCLGSRFKYRIEIRGLRRKVSLLEQEIHNLRNIPLKGPH